MVQEILRCEWATKGSLDEHYHDTVWGIPLHDDDKLFKMLILEGQQAGLSWSTILAKEEALCEAFDDFDPVKLASYDDKKIEELMSNPGIIRNRLKINSAITNAQAYLKLKEEGLSFDEYLWSFVDHKPITNSWESMDQIPATTPESEALSKDLKKRGFKFVGPTIAYALMQAVGMVNDHLTWCSFRNPDRLKK